MDRSVITRTLVAGLLMLASWTAFPAQQARAGGASLSSPSGGGGDAGQSTGALNVSPGLSFDPGVGQTRVTIDRSSPPATSTATSSATNNRNDQNVARQGVAHGTVRPFSQMLKIIRHAAPGDLVKVRLRQRAHGPWIYDVTVLGQDGRYVLLTLNAADGRIISRTTR